MPTLREGGHPRPRGNVRSRRALGLRLSGAGETQSTFAITRLRQSCGARGGRGPGQSCREGGGRLQAGSLQGGAAGSGFGDPRKAGTLSDSSRRISSSGFNLGAVASPSSEGWTSTPPQCQQGHGGLSPHSLGLLSFCV